MLKQQSFVIEKASIDVLGNSRVRPTAAFTGAL